MEKRLINCKINYKEDQNNDRAATELHFGLIINSKGSRSQKYAIDLPIGNNIQMLWYCEKGFMQASCPYDYLTKQNLDCE